LQAISNKRRRTARTVNSKYIIRLLITEEANKQNKYIPQVTPSNAVRGSTHGGLNLHGARAKKKNQKHTRFWCSQAKFSLSKI